MDKPKFGIPFKPLGKKLKELRNQANESLAEASGAVEIDVRLSKDKKLFVMHDSTLDRTTNSKGSLGNMLSDDLVAVRLKENDESIPTFQDIYAITRGRAMLFADIKGDCVRAVAEWVAKNGSFDDIVFILNSDAEFRSAAEMKLKYPLMIISAEAYSKQDILLVEKHFPNPPDIIDIGFPAIWKYSFVASGSQKIYASSLVLEIGLPFLRPIWSSYMGIWSFDFLETNNPLFWKSRRWE